MLRAYIGLVSSLRFKGDALGELFRKLLRLGLGFCYTLYLFVLLNIS